MPVKARSLMIGIATYISGVRSLSSRMTGGTISARYCYSVWLRHLIMLHRAGQRTRFDTMVELGPGDSLGTGLAALLSGVQRYIALDALQYGSSERNLAIFEELVALFRAQHPFRTIANSRKCGRCSHHTPSRRRFCGRPAWKLHLTRCD
jgi:hypothetical protein